MESKNRNGILIKILSVVLFLFGTLAFFGSVFTWGQGFILLFPKNVDYSYPITDILINAPFSIIASIGIWRYKRYGFVLGYFVSGFYIYASVEIFVQVFQKGKPYAIEILIPQILAVIVAFILCIKLWKVKNAFMKIE